MFAFFSSSFSFLQFHDIGRQPHWWSSKEDF
jgi:hypothetical protein